MKKKLLLLLLLVPMLSSCELIKPEDISNKLIPNLGSFLTQLSALLVLIIVVIIFGYKPIKKMIKKRQDYVESNIKEAEIKNQEASQNLSQSNEAILANRRLATEIVEEAKAEAENQRQEILKQAELEVIEMKKRAEADIKQSEEDAKEEIRQKMIEVALAASSELLKRNVDNKDNEKLVDDFIREIDA
ncbi:MAG: F0F1 ATP synthase subunit B [Bacilli bacterium]|nr:F0F1 ATP synthase subunit B [Bacilli bacterium]